MSKLLSTLAVATLTTAAFASPAFAGDMAKKAEMKPSTTMMPMPAQATTTVVEAPEARMLAIRASAETEVASATALGEFTAVQGPDGKVFYNHVVPVSELPDPELNLRVVDTVTVEHGGQTYTNKIVQPLN